MEAQKHSKMAWLWENMKGYRVIYLFSILGTILYNVMQLVVPYITQKIVDLFLTGDDAAANIVNKRDIFFQLIIAYICENFDSVSGMFGCGACIPEGFISCQNPFI